MTNYETAVAGNAAYRPARKCRAPLIAELYDMTGGDLRLLMIYKKIEIAAETGDWSLMNDLYREFKMAQATIN